MNYYGSDRRAFLSAERDYLTPFETPFEWYDDCEVHVLTCALCDTAIRDCDCEETDDHSGTDYCPKCQMANEEAANPCAECGVECGKCEERNGTGK